MLKNLHLNDTQLKSFVVTKYKELSNVTNEDLILMEDSGSSGPPVGLEYIDYTPDTPIVSSGCNISLEQQSTDVIIPKDGTKTSGLFYPNTEEVNLDGTYKRLIYSQIHNLFYNNYRDPSKMWGIENIDFDISKTKRFLSDGFILLDIPTNIFGEKLVKNSILIFDTNSDNNYTLTDDGNCNMFVMGNIFSRQQEVGFYSNSFVTGSTGYCLSYDSI